MVPPAADRSMPIAIGTAFDMYVKLLKINTPRMSILTITNELPDWRESTTPACEGRRLHKHPLLKTGGEFPRRLLLNERCHYKELVRSPARAGFIHHDIKNLAIL